MALSSAAERHTVQVFLAADSTVRIIVGDLTGVVARGASIHGTSPVVTAALGRALMAGALMTHLLGDGEKATLQWIGDGPIGRVLVVAEPDHTVRGFATNPAVVISPTPGGKLDVGGAVGRNGQLVVVRDLGFGEPYVGSVPLVSGEIAEDLAAYFLTSEQVPSAVSLGVLVAPEGSVVHAGGFMLQALPGATADLLADLDGRVSALPAITAVMSEGAVTSIAQMLLGDYDVECVEEFDVAYACTCSHERLERILLSLGAAELRGLAASSESVDVACDFCRTRYSFTPRDVAELVDHLADTTSSASDQP